MDSKSKEYYRNKIKEISKKTKISEIYITRKILDLANKNENNKEEKKSHIGYYLIDEGILELYKELKYKPKINIKTKAKTKIYIISIIVFSIIISFFMSAKLNIEDTFVYIIAFILFFIPATEIVNQVISYILSKIVKPKIIPKIDFLNGIDEENSTMVVIPTIVKSREKVQELMGKLEVFYLANKSENLYFCLLGDCSESKYEEEEFDKDVIEEGKKQVEILNQKYPNKKIPIFNFIYRKRIFNEKEESYLGWERKRGMLSQFNEYLLRKYKNTI